MLKSRSGSRCPVCEFIVPPDKIQAHQESKLHMLNLIKHKLSTNEEGLTKDKEGIRFDCPETNENGTCFTLRCDISKFADISVVIHSDRYDVRLQEAVWLVFDSGAEVSLMNPVENSPQIIRKGSSHSLKIRGFAPQQCRKMKTLVMKFSRHGQPNIFLVRYIRLVCIDETITELEPLAPYVSVEPIPRLPEAQKIIKIKSYVNKVAQARPVRSKVEFVPGEDEDPEYIDDPINTSEKQNEVSLFMYSAPAFLAQIHIDGLGEKPDMDEEYKETFNKLLKTLDLGINAENPENYDVFFQILLHFEDIQQQADIRMYDNPCAELISVEGDVERFLLKVEGLEEGRPSVLPYDKIYIREEGKLVEYEGIIDRTRANAIEIIMNEQFVELYHSYVESDSEDEEGTLKQSGMRFGVRFSTNRKVMRLMHRAVCQYRKMLQELQMPIDKLLMPYIQWPANPAVDQLDDLEFSNKNIRNNPEQLCAVRNIILGLHRPAAYVLFGPPGTGKTTTISEAIIQVYKLIPESSILIVTPSNAAANVVAEKILKSGSVVESDIFRMYGVTCNQHKASALLKPISNWQESTGKFEGISRQKLELYRIFICTIAISGTLVSMGVPRGHFTHIFIDEAGHAMEPEALIPLTGLLSAYDGRSKIGGSVILSGDHLQLGPVIRSPVAKYYGLGLSLLERIMLTEPYSRQKNGSYNPMNLTKLVQNFRSHPKILETPNKLFYDGELEALGDKDYTHSMIMYERLPTKGVPMIFHGVFGRELREENNPSFFNPEEISVVVDYIRSLLSPETKTLNDDPITQNDIGIIAPYRKQVLKFRCILKQYGFDEITVGSTEEFQGQEYLIMFISTVRCSARAFDYNQGKSLGFLRNHKRFNVATTRAKALMIVVGDPRVLNKDYCWRHLLSTCSDYNAWAGERTRSTAEQFEDIFKKLEEIGFNLGLKELKGVKLSSNGRVAITQVSLQEEPRWRDSD